MLLNCGAGEDSRESLGQQDQASQSQRKSTVNVHWKIWCWSSNTLAPWCEEPTHWKRNNPDAGKDWGQEEKGTTEDETVGWHHWLSGPEFEEILGDREGQGSLACCSLWGQSRLSDWTTTMCRPPLWSLPSTPPHPIPLGCQRHSVCSLSLQQIPTGCLFCTWDFIRFVLLSNVDHLKVIIELVLLLFCVLAFWPPGLWDVHSLPRDPTCSLWIGRWDLNPWATREVPFMPFWAL